MADLTPAQIPDEAVAPLVNQILDQYGIDIAFADARATILAAVNAWPGMRVNPQTNPVVRDHAIILPLEPRHDR